MNKVPINYLQKEHNSSLILYLTWPRSGLATLPVLGLGPFKVYPSKAHNDSFQIVTLGVVLCRSNKIFKYYRHFLNIPANFKVNLSEEDFELFQSGPLKCPSLIVSKWTLVWCTLQYFVESRCEVPIDNLISLSLLIMEVRTSMHLLKNELMSNLVSFKSLSKWISVMATLNCFKVSPCVVHSELPCGSNTLASSV